MLRCFTSDELKPPPHPPVAARMAESIVVLQGASAIRRRDPHFASFYRVVAHMALRLSSGAVLHVRILVVGSGTEGLARHLSIGGWSSHLLRATFRWQQILITFYATAP